MEKRIVAFSPHKTALTVACVFALCSLLFLVPMALMFSFLPSTDQHGNAINMGVPIGMLLVMPIFYFIFGYLGTAFSAWVYNRIAKWTGGIKFQLAD